jgi:molybdate/tungstate transport system substrate-binding protein
LKHLKDGAISTSATVALVIIVIIIVVASVSYYYLTRSTAPVSSNTSASGGLILYSADAYVNETQTLENAFSTNSGVSMLAPKSAGSSVLGADIGAGDPVSVFVSVSKTAIQNATLGKYYPGWAVAFATDQMALVYANANLQNSAAMAVISSYKTAVTANTTLAWYDFFSNLTSGTVKVGISDPNQDPAGYRAWMVLQAAGAAYDNNVTTYFPGRMLSSASNVTGASAADLVAPLQAGQIQFLFIYKSVATSDKLNVMTLPPQINLGSPTYSGLYSRLSYTIISNGVPSVETGGVITLWISVPTDSTNLNSSISFVVYVVKNAPTLLANYGLTLYSPAKLFNDSAVPTPIAQLATEGELKPSGVLA